jgi:hypothetical protein
VPPRGTLTWAATTIAESFVYRCAGECRELFEEKSTTTAVFVALNALFVVLLGDRQNNCFALE